MENLEISMYNILMDEIDKLSTRLHGAVVFVDAGFTDVLHWLGGANLLLNYGAVAIKEFSSFEGGGKDEHKALIFLSSAYQFEEEASVSDIIKNSHFSSVSVVTNVHPAIQALVRFRPVNDEEVAEIVRGIEKNIKAWINNKIGIPGKGDFMYVNLSYSPILPSTLFTIPSHSSFFPLTPYQINLLTLRNKMPLRPTEQPKVEFEHLPKEMQLQYKLLVSSINSVCDSMGIEEEIFSVGVSSGIIAQELDSLSWKGSRKPSKRSASLLLIDRTLDLSTPTHHSFESTLDRILSTLPPTLHHDVSIDLSPILSPINDPSSHSLDNRELHGNLAQPGDNKSTSLLNTFTLLKQKEVTMQLNRVLSSLLTKENLGVAGGKGVGIEGLVKNIAAVKNNIVVIRKNSGLLQMILAFVQTCKCQRQKSFENLQRIEKMILQCIGSDNRDGGGDEDDCLALKVLDEFWRVRDEDSEMNFPLDDLLTLLLHTFSINQVCMSSTQQLLLETRLTQELMVASKQRNEYSLIPWDDVCSSSSEGDSRLVAQEILCQIKWLPYARFPLRQYKSVVTKGSITSPTSHRPIIKQILDDITDPSNQLLDIKKRSSGLGNMLKSGLGFLMGGAQKEGHPLDHHTLVVFVVGGIGVGEVKMVVDHLASKRFKGQVIIGSTTLLTPHKLMQLTLFNRTSFLL